MDQKQRTPRVRATHQDCGCARAFRLSQEHHDWLTSFEERGLPGVLELISHCNRSADNEAGEDTLMWIDFPTFVAMHSWTNPADVHDLANFIAGAIWHRREYYDATKALRMVAAAAQEGVAHQAERRNRWVG